jgi:hypothetical protein
VLRRGVGAGPKSSPVITPHRTENLRGGFRSEKILIASIIVDADWQWWPIVAIAFFYALAILTIVIVTLVRSARMRHKRGEKTSSIES